MNTTRTIIHSDGHTDIETYLQDADGVWIWAVTQCNGGLDMTAKMTQLEYAKTYAPASRIPESFLTMGGVVELLERIEELKADLANANEGAKLLHSLAIGGEQSVLSRLDNGADVQDAVRWQDDDLLPCGHSSEHLGGFGGCNPNGSCMMCEATKQDEGSKTINLNGYKATATAAWRERHLNEGD